ncbi:hypothetical protein OUZ56_001259 [Daphnia magna]|uniref:Uncharacterized protein n=1 Tax=Daphnia magna TaxID=35525 RepID=A0ABR0A240_9CRUS|nr:hypothetical protein OUZ56_001259 [Daphnia magna]
MPCNDIFISYFRLLFSIVFEFVVDSIQRKIVVYFYFIGGLIEFASDAVDERDGKMSTRFLSGWDK